MNGLRWSEEQLAAHQRSRLPMVSPAPAKPSKHRSVPTMRGALRFDSKHEAEQWDALCLRLRAGDIDRLQRQVTFPFTVDGVRVGHYKADFFYHDSAWHVADAKSAHTKTLPGWHRTKQLMRACYGIEIEEV